MEQGGAYQAGFLDYWLLLLVNQPILPNYRPIGLLNRVMKNSHPNLEIACRHLWREERGCRIGCWGGG
jgi:hypothetical protein